MDELNKTAERNTELEARIGFMLSSRQVAAHVYTVLSLVGIDRSSASAPAGLESSCRGNPAPAEF